MSRKIYTDQDVDLSVLRGKTIVAVGYGTQGKAQALNLRDSGLRVVVAAERSSSEWAKAEQEGFPVHETEAAAREGDVFNLQVPDMAYRCAAVYNEKIKPAAKPQHLICLSSAFNFYYAHIKPAPTVDAVVAAPKGPGAAVRTEFAAGRGVPGILAVHQDASGQAWDLGLALCKGIGFTRAGVQKTTVEEETCTDLLGEHCAWGAIVQLLKTVFEVMVEEGFDPEVAFYEAVNESKLTTDLIYKFGMAGMLERISNTAAYGAMTVGPKIIDGRVKENIRAALSDIKNGTFDTDWKNDYCRSYPNYRRLLSEIARHPADVIGNEIRKRLGVLQEADFSARNPLES
ncbi:MAG: ketol-acid reductoisomerase [Acidobacteriota bacterium]